MYSLVDIMYSLVVGIVAISVLVGFLYNIISDFTEFNRRTKRELGDPTKSKKRKKHKVTYLEDL